MTLFRSFFIGGFECSTHRLRSGKRLDLIKSTGHDRYALQDYQRLCQQGIFTARSGIRWHLIEKKPGQYDFSSVLPMLHAAQQTGVQIIWDICHYGWPEQIDIFKPQFVQRFARFASAFAHLLAQETDELAFITPMNEISFFSWAGGEAGYLDPYEYGRGFELKLQLARSAIEGMEAIWQVLPTARMVHVDPVINILPNPSKPEEASEAEGHRLAQYQGWDLLSGRIHPEIGGAEKYLDIIGVNYYPANQWVYNLENAAIPRRDARYKPFRNILSEVYQRYQRPMFVSETGTEKYGRAAWLRYIGEEVREAIRMSVPMHGICWYPILNHPGWLDDRHCHNGLWDYCNETGEREIYKPLADELHRQQELFSDWLPEICSVPLFS
jgi:beta-glucosidase/6-phospho-beta-glucosidase/beta-galactosidase